MEVLVDIYWVNFMWLNKLADLEVIYQERKEEIFDDRLDIIDFLKVLIFEFKKYLNPDEQAITLGTGNITDELIETYLKKENDSLNYILTFPINKLGRYGKAFPSHVFIECISQDKSQSIFRFHAYEKDWSLSLKNSDVPQEYIEVFDHIYESLKEQINKSCDL